jgi:VanZ family protein
VKKLISNFFVFWLPPLIWAFVIFYISSGSVPKAGPTYWVDFAIKKAAHLLEYAIFAILFYRAFKNSGWGKSQSVTIALFLAILYGATDELHQLFTPGRESRIRDVIFDTIGAGAGLYLIWKLLPKMPKRLRVWAEKLHLI